MRRPMRLLSTVLIVAGLLMLGDAGITLAWQEPVSSIYARIMQDRLGDDLRKLELATPSASDLAALKSLESQRRRMAFLARSLRSDAGAGEAIGRIRIPKIDASYVLVNGTEAEDLRKGPGFYPGNPLPGVPGTVAVAGHRTTYLAPFRNIDDLRRKDTITIDMPYGHFVYSVEGKRIVKPTDTSVVKRVSFDRLVLSACHPLYSAAQRIIVFARLESAQPKGAALDS